MTSLAPWYLPIRSLHIALVVFSGSLFLLRGIGVLAGARWPMNALCKRGSMVIDTLLLLAGATLWSVAALNPLRDHWLLGKLLLLPVYVVLGSFALKRARSPHARALCFALALGCLAAMAVLALFKPT